MFALHIQTGNAALSDEPEFELVRILRSLADDLAYAGPMTGPDDGPLYDANGNAVGRWSYVPEPGTDNLPEGTEADCLHCGDRILLDQREGGGPAKDWGSTPDRWQGNGGIGMDYGCPDSPDDDGTGGHAPDPDTITLP